MRRMFIVFAKLLGLLMFYWTLSLFVATAWAFESMFDPLRSVFKTVWWFLSSLGNFALTLTFALLLTFKTERVADWLKLRGDEGVAKSPSTRLILATGSSLIGIYVLVYAIPFFVANLLKIASYPQGWDKHEFTRMLVTYGSEILLSAILIFKADAIAAFIERRRLSAGEASPPDMTETRM